MTKLKSAKDIAYEIPDYSVIALVGFGGMGQCDEILFELGKRFLETGKPENLTIFHTAGQSGRKNGIEYIAYEKLIAKIIGGHWGLAPKLSKLIEENKVICHCWPQGQLTHYLRALACGSMGQISKVGLKTFVDPRFEGGRINDAAKGEDSLIDLIQINSEEMLLYKKVKLDYIFIRGTSIDSLGNLSCEEEALKLEILSGAQAVKASGGKVIVQAKYLCQPNSLHPKDVIVPEYLVDSIVICQNPDEFHKQTPGTVYSPFYNGNTKVPLQAVDNLDFSIKKIIGRRAIKEINDKVVVNIGIGVPGDVIGPIIAEEGLSENVILTLESGVVGGVPIGGNEFGVAKNPTTIMDHEYLFDYYHGTGVDITFMGAAEIDVSGSVNVSKFGDRIIGCGGFIDITQSAKSIVYCSTFTSGGLEAIVENNELKIISEGKNKKFVSGVKHVTYSGEYGAEMKQRVVYVTERAVFKLVADGLELIEIAPGIDLQKDILDLMDFKPLISKDLKQMEADLFLN